MSKFYPQGQTNDMIHSPMINNRMTEQNNKITSWSIIVCSDMFSTILLQQTSRDFPFKSLLRRSWKTLFSVRNSLDEIVHSVVGQCVSDVCWLIFMDITEATSTNTNSSWKAGPIVFKNLNRGRYLSVFRCCYRKLTTTTSCYKLRIV